MAATRKPRSPSAAGVVDHHRFLRPGALARLRDARLRRRKPTASRFAPPSSPSPSPAPSSSTPPPPAAAVDGEGGAVMPYFVPVSKLLAPRCPQRKKLAAAKGVMLFAPPPPSPDLPVEVAMEFLSSPDMVVAAH
ncbi:hypothetical protein E2562_016814 [Oryza meyeriana var. granulata]|uniref:Uncharacterized protein n=1 Tax=Oryza meyeriana var. granulata TaxID=110450 RepID=A0A6G1BWL1_9ORYZ|nr:hypothetical protein E2562_016814 [Oryza meyeriana var. granulata]